MKRLYKYIRNYGIRGVLIYLKIKLGLTKNISVPKISYPIYLRNSTSDIPAFNQVFMDLEYYIKTKFQPQAIIDAGANIGLAAVYFANRYPDTKIISIEPEKSNFDILVKNTSAYQNIDTLHRAISNIPDKYVEIVDNGYGEWGFVTKMRENHQNDDTNSLVKTITIGDIVKEYGFKNIDIAKIDIEGAEKELFESNFQDWVPITKCIIIELHDGMKKGASKSFFHAISQYNFSFSHRGENLIFINQNKNYPLAIGSIAEK